MLKKVNCLHCGEKIRPRKNKDFCGVSEGDKNGKCRASYAYQDRKIIDAHRIVSVNKTRQTRIESHTKHTKDTEEDFTVSRTLPIDQRLHSLLFEFYYEQRGKIKSIDIDYLIHTLKENNIPYKPSEMKNWTGVYVAYNPTQNHAYRLFFTTKGLILQPDPYHHENIHEAIPHVKEDIDIINSFFNNLFHPNFSLSTDVRILKRIQNAFIGNEIAKEAKDKDIEPITITLKTGETVRLFWDESDGIELELETDTFQAQESGSGNIQSNMKLLVEHDLSPLVTLPETMQKSLEVQEAMRLELQNARLYGGVSQDHAFRAFEMEIAQLLTTQKEFVKKITPVMEKLAQKKSVWERLSQIFKKIIE